MSFEPKKFIDVYEDMQARSSLLTDFEVGSVSRTLFESFSYEMALLYEKMNLIYLSAFVDSAQGFQLDQVVAILGVKRSLPDFSVGTVTFERDLGNEDISIPVGTLVATEDSPENPKKVYQTIEQKLLRRNESTVAIKVQALQAGENQDAAQGSIIVMPRPVPGIKSVINNEVIRLIGRRRETDEELRERAKNTLIASGKANILAIENAVLSLRRVLDVKVMERFHYPEGEVRFTRTDASQKSYIPKGSMLSFIDTTTNKWRYRILDDVPFPKSIVSGKALVRALKEGGQSELEASAVVEFEDQNLGNDFAIDQHDPIVRGDYGLVEVYVDALDFDEPYEPGQPETLRAIVQKEIEGVRAAGIFVTLSEARKIEVDAVIQIAVSPSLNLNEEERLIFETEVKNQIGDFFISLKLGETFSFSQMIKTVISIEGVDNLEDFWLQTVTTRGADPFTIEYSFSNNKITSEDHERFSARHICVASEEKTLPIHIEFQATNIANVFDLFRESMLPFFEEKKTGDEILKSELEQEVSNQLIALSAALIPGTFKVMPESWCGRPILLEEDGDQIVKTSFVEKPVLGEHLFAYENELVINGAISMELSPNLTQVQKNTVYLEVQKTLKAYIAELRAEEDFQFSELINRIEPLPQVRAAGINADDFQASLPGEIVPDRIDDESIGVDPFEKLVSRHILITDGMETIKMQINRLEIELTLSEDQTSNQINLVNDLKTLLAHSINHFFDNSPPGDNMIYATFKTALENLISELDYQINVLTIQARSADGRLQTATMTEPNEIQVRSVELAQVVTFDPDDSAVLDITVISSS